MTILQNRYELLEVLAEGGENVVYFAKDQHTQERVVLKRTKNGIPPEAQTSWQRATTLLKQLDISTVAKVYDSFINVENMVTYGYVVQQYIDGETLESEYNRKRYTQTEILSITREVMAIVCQLQEFRPPILHRDIKPANIIRRKRDGKLILLDFGLATELQDKEFGHTMGVGTFGYQAPEQLSGFPTLNTDVYSVGVIALQFLTRREPKDLLWGNTLEWESSAQLLHDDWKNWLKQSLAPTEERFEDAEDALEAINHHGFGEKRRKTAQSEIPKTKQTKRNKHTKEAPSESMVGSRQTHQKSSKTPAASTDQNLENDRHMARVNILLEEEARRTQRYFMYSIIAFFIVGFFAIPFIWHYNKKRKELRMMSELNKLQYLRDNGFNQD